MRRSIEKRVDALEAASGQNAPDLLIMRWLVGPGEAEQEKKDQEAFEPSVLMSGARRWLREAGETVKQFEQRAFDEMPRPANGARVLWAEGNQ